MVISRDRQPRVTAGYMVSSHHDWPHLCPVGILSLLEMCHGRSLSPSTDDGRNDPCPLIPAIRKLDQSRRRPARRTGSCPSFGKGLYLGDFQPELISPQPDLPADSVEKGERFLTILGEFLRSEVDPQAIERERKISDDVIDGFKELGALGMKMPEEYGGLGLTQVYYNRAMMLVGLWHSALSRAAVGAPVDRSCRSRCSCSAPTSRSANSCPRSPLRTVGAFLLTEPGVGSDPARLRTTAIPDRRGAATCWTASSCGRPTGRVADLLVVMARVPSSRGSRGRYHRLRRRATSPGITVENRNAFMGLRGIENGETRSTERTRAGREPDRPGGLGPQDRPDHAQHGPPRRCPPCAPASASGRRRSPASGPAYACSGAARSASTTRSRRRSPSSPRRRSDWRRCWTSPARLADDEHNDIRIEAAIAKLYGSEMGWRVIDELMQICGGRGYETAESLQARGLRGVPVEQIMRDMRINRIFEGSTEIMHLMIAREAMDQHLHVAGDLMESDQSRSTARPRQLGRAGAFYANWYPDWRSGPAKSYAPTPVTASWPARCDSSSGPAASSPARRSTRWHAGRPPRRSRSRPGTDRRHRS